MNDDKDLLHDCCHTKEEGFAGCEHKISGPLACSAAG
jgi:hypothetical protein